MSQIGSGEDELAETERVAASRGAALHVDDIPAVLTRDAECLNHGDPPFRRLASARWRLATGGSHEDWLRLREVDPAAAVRDVQNAVRRAEGGPHGRQERSVGVQN